MSRFLSLASCALAITILTSCSSEKAAPEPVAPPPAPVKIVAFYPGQTAVAPGDQAQVCYGVENAASVRLEPPVEEIRPLTSKCIWFKPGKSMDLTLIATGAKGDEVRETIPIKVQAGAPATTRVAPVVDESGIIETFIATASSVPAGGGSTLCYVLREPAKLTLQPASGDLGTDLKKCVLVRPRQTTNYTLTATAGSKSDSASVTIRVE